MNNDFYFFTSGHGIYDFAVSSDAFNRSLYYGLLLHPGIAIPDLYLIQGDHVGNHLRQYPNGDSWIEAALSSNVIVPFFREKAQTFCELHDHMLTTDLRGIKQDARAIAERLDETHSKKASWIPTENSRKFNNSLRWYLADTNPKVFLEWHSPSDPDDFIGFWQRSEDWRREDIEFAASRARNPGTLPVSLILQGTTTRVFKDEELQFQTVTELTAAMRGANFDPTTIRDTEIFFSVVCELYNRNIAEALLAGANSPLWSNHVAALHLTAERLERAAQGRPDPYTPESLEQEIRLPPIHVLCRTPGAVLKRIRRDPTAAGYFEALALWKHEATPFHEGKLLECLVRYSEVIRYEVGKLAPSEPHLPLFAYRADQLISLVNQIPDVVYGVGIIQQLPILKWSSFALLGLKNYVGRRNGTSSKKAVEVSPQQPGGFRLSNSFSIKRFE